MCVKWCPMTSLSISFSLVSLSLFLSRSPSWSVQGPRGGGAVVDCRPAAARALAPRSAQGSYPRRLSLPLSLSLPPSLSLSHSSPPPPLSLPLFSLAHSHTSDRTISRQREELHSCVRRPAHIAPSVHSVCGVGLRTQAHWASAHTVGLRAQRPTGPAHTWAHSAHRPTGPPHTD
jgi:hypothetical protein